MTEHSQTQQRIYHKMLNLKLDMDRLVREFEATLPSARNEPEPVMVYNPMSKKLEPVKMNKGG